MTKANPHAALADELDICPQCNGSGVGVADTTCLRCDGSGGVRNISALRTQPPADTDGLVERLRAPDRWDAHYYSQGFGTSNNLSAPFEAATALTTALAHIEALLRVVDDWRPIETAPRDGSVVLAYRHDAGVFTMHYVEEDAHTSSYMNPPEGDCYWFTTGGDDLTDDMPAHWRPLPDPPATDKPEVREAAAFVKGEGE
jgi:hypothetical protein